jgi:hypothetical protein
MDLDLAKPSCELNLFAGREGLNVKQQYLMLQECEINILKKPFIQPSRKLNAHDLDAERWAQWAGIERGK